MNRAEPLPYGISFPRTFVRAKAVSNPPCAERCQVTEVPRMEPEIAEYRRHRLCCLACGTGCRAKWYFALFV
jgi:hypothetical protein